jgi:hypothetical protein
MPWTACNPPCLPSACGGHSVVMRYDADPVVCVSVCLRYKVMGMDARYDCFDCQASDVAIICYHWEQALDLPPSHSIGLHACLSFPYILLRRYCRHVYHRPGLVGSQVAGVVQVNHFTPKPGDENVMIADVQFRMPRPRPPGFWENHITEELIGDEPSAKRSMHSVGRMFGLTFWENWYIIGQNQPNDGLPPFKFVYYTGHTLQGNYEGAFVYARTPELPPELMPAVSRVAREKGLDPTKFCKIRNACFASAPVGVASSSSSSSPAPQAKAPHLFLAQKIIQLTSFVTQEIDDWFEDPAATSDWLIKQQERMVLIDQGSPVKGAKKTAAVVKAVVKPDPPPPTPPPSYADLLAREQKGL